MPSNNATYGGFASQAERQPVSLPKILERYVTRGYAVWELPQTESVRSLVNGNRLQWLRTRNLEVLDLDTILATHPPAAALRPGYEYIALPSVWRSVNGGNGNGMVVPCYEIRVSGSHFIIGKGSIFALDVCTQMPAELTIADFYNALERLEPVTQQVVREKQKGQELWGTAY